MCIRDRSVHSVDIKADDPGGLTESEWKADPQQAQRAEKYKTSKTRKTTQADRCNAHKPKSQAKMRVRAAP